MTESVYERMVKYCKERGWPTNTQPLSTVLDELDALEKMSRSVTTVQLDPGGVIVLILKEKIDFNTAKRFESYLKGTFPNNKVLILDNDTVVKIVNPPSNECGRDQVAEKD